MTPIVANCFVVALLNYCITAFAKILDGVVVK